MASTICNIGYNTDNKPSSRILQAPGGTSIDIFGIKDSSNGEHSSSSSDAGSMTPSCPSTPTPLNGSTNGLNIQNGQLHSLDSGSDSSTPSSASSSRRGSRQEDTKNRLFGAEMESPRRRVVDRMKSNIFAEPTGNHVRATPAKKVGDVVRRNPITGEVYADQHNGHGKSNGYGNGSISLPSTPVRVRQPPGGKSSGIF